MREGIRFRARRALGIERLDERIDLLEQHIRSLDPDGWERSRVRWRQVSPDFGLTWGRLVTGDAFTAKVAEYGGFGSTAAILEIGPGYGRLLASCLERGYEFREYLGLDISEANVERLRGAFDDPRVQFIVADAERATFEGRYDLLISSLVFKHLYPSFERVLANASAHLNARALICFDLIEGDHRMFEADGVTYVRCYTRDEAGEIIQRTGLELVEFTTVRHDATHERLLAVARKP